MAPGNPPGDIAFYNEQNALALDESKLRRTLTDIRRLLGYDTYDVTLILVDDDEMKSVNRESRGMNEPTDILSFPFHAAKSPGVLEDIQFDIPDYYMLVRIMVALNRIPVTAHSFLTSFFHLNFSTHRVT